MRNNTSEIPISSWREGRGRCPPRQEHFGRARARDLGRPRRRGSARAGIGPRPAADPAVRPRARSSRSSRVRPLSPAAKAYEAAWIVRRCRASSRSDGVSRRACSESSAATVTAPRTLARPAASSRAAAVSASGPSAPTARWCARSSASATSSTSRRCKCAPFTLVCGRADGRRDQRMGEADAIPVKFDHVIRERRCEHRRRVTPDSTRNEIEGRMCQRRDDQEVFPRFGRERRKPVLHERGQRSRQWLALLESDGTSLKLPDRARERRTDCLQTTHGAGATSDARA